MTGFLSRALAAALLLAAVTAAPAGDPAVSAESAESAFRDGRAHYEVDDYVAAADAFERAAAAAPESSEILGWLGRTYAKLASENRSPVMALKTRRALERAVDLDGCNRRALEDLMKFYDAAPFVLGGSAERASRIRVCLGRDVCPCEGRDEP